MVRAAYQRAGYVALISLAQIPYFLIIRRISLISACSLISTCRFVGLSAIRHISCIRAYVTLDLDRCTITC